MLSKIIVSQNLHSRYNNLGEIFVEHFSSAPFPHPKRANGHIYKETLYPAEKHYSDSSVMIFIPNGFRPAEKTNFVIYLHGWYNNIDSACAQFYLIEQFAESKKNAIFIFPEGPKNAPDSFGGKLEDKNGLKILMDDIISFLKSKHKIKNDQVGKIVLAGHSGAYRAIAFTLMHGGLTRNISDVILFDALYAQTDMFIHWIKSFDGRFINIYTDDGGTKKETENLIRHLENNDISFYHKEETKLNKEDLKNNRIIFIHSDLTHNQVISNRNQFKYFLQSSNLKNIR